MGSMLTGEGKIAATLPGPASGFDLRALSRIYAGKMLIRAHGDCAANRGIRCEPQAIPPYLACKVSMYWTRLAMRCCTSPPFPLLMLENNGPQTGMSWLP